MRALMTFGEGRFTAEYFCRAGLPAIDSVAVAVSALAVTQNKRI